MSAWELHTEPYRHYRANGSWSIGPKGAKRRILSVTQVLDAADDRLQSWMLGQAFIAGEKDGCAPGLAARAYAAGWGPEAIRDKAAALGTISHAAWEARCTGMWKGAKEESRIRAARYMAGADVDRAAGQPITAADLWPRFRALEDCFAEHSFITEQTETVVGSERYAYAGTFDWFGKLDGAAALVDVKNTNMLSWRHPVQLGGYENARREMGMPPARKLFVLRLHANATYDLVDVARLGGYGAARTAFLRALTQMRYEKRTTGTIDKINKELAP